MPLASPSFKSSPEHASTQDRLDHNCYNSIVLLLYDMGKDMVIDCIDLLCIWIVLMLC